ncbi:MAG: CHAT domain-containing protein [Anaerolineae bacterium]
MDVLEIVIQRRSGAGWPVVVEYKQAGEFLPVRREGTLQLDSAAQELQQKEFDPLAYGTVLGEALFRENIRDAFMQARAQSPDHLRVLLVIEDPELRPLHWESLCAPIGVAGRWQHLALDQRSLFSLYLPSLTDRRFPAIARRDLRTLVLVANPPQDNSFGLAHFDGPDTVESVREALGEIPHEILANVEGADGKPTLNELAQRITAQHYTILHIVAHGWYRDTDGETILYLLDESGQVRPTPATRLIERLGLLQGARGLPHLTFLSTCESAAPEAEREGALGGLAQRLVRELGMPAVVAMTKRVSIDTATALACRFYERLRDHGEVAQALVEAGVALADAGDITVPALYERLGGRPLFSDTMDRELTDSEVQDGLARLGRLLDERAPVLKETWANQADILQGLLGADRSALTQEARQQWDEALDEVNAICEETLDLNFRALALGQKPPAYDRRCPFPGLAAFQPDDQEFFFGREALIADLVQRLEVQPFLALLGPSGSGKSSAALAGLVPALREAQPELQLAYLTPGADPSARLTASLGRLRRDRPALVLVDQFEELFTLVEDDDKRQGFLERLLALPEQLPVAITMRADFLGECAPYPDLRDAIQTHMALIAPMDTAELRSAMEQQASAVGLRFEADLSHTILDAVKEEPGAMPLLQHALLEMWNRRHGRWLRSSEYRKIGGVQRAIAETADKIYEQVSESDRAHLRDVFVRLTRLGESGAGEERRDTRHRVQFDELIPAGSDPAVTRRLVQRLADARLVVTSVNESTEQEEVEVAHEALIRYWPRLKGWLDEDRDLLRLREGIRQAAREWQSSPEEERGDRLIHRGSRLEEIEAFVRAGRLALNEQEGAYVTACVEQREAAKRREEEQRQRELELARERAAEAEARQKAEEEARRQADQRAQQERRNARNVRRAAIVVGVVAVIALLAGIFAFIQMGVAARAAADEERARQTAQAEADIRATEVVVRQTAQADAEVKQQQAIAAEATAVAEGERAKRQANLALSRQIASQALANLDNQFDRALLFSLEANRIADTREAKDSLLAAVAYHPNITTFLHGHTDGVYAVALSPDGKTLASASSDHTVRLWDVDSRQPVGSPLTRHDASVMSVAFSPDGQILASGSADGAIILWDVAERLSLGRPLLGHDAEVRSVAFSPDGKLLASASSDWTIMLWDVASRQPVGEPLTGHDGGVWSVAFSPDGQILASGSVDATVRLWDLSNREPIGEPLAGHDDLISSVAFSPDGQTLASGSHDGLIFLWDVATRQPLGEPLDGYASWVWSVAFSPDGEILVSGNDDQTILLWDVDSGELLRRPLTGHAAAVRSVAFGPDGNTLASGSWDRTILLWNIQGGESLSRPLIGHEDWVESVAFSPDGTILASGSDDQSIILWDVASGEPLGEPLTGHSHYVLDIAFSPDGQTLGSGSADGTVILWDVASGEPLGQPLIGHEDWVESVAFSPDGAILASGSDDETILLWDVASGQRLGESLVGHSDFVLGIAFSPDGQTLASGSSDGTVILWEVASGEPLGQPLVGHTEEVFEVAFSPDGKILASASNDQTIRLWDVASGQPLSYLLTGHTLGVKTLAFSPDGQTLASGSDDADILLWDVTTGQPRGRPLTGHAASVMSVAFSPDGQMLASGSDDQTLRLWDLSFDSWEARACRRANRNLTQSEWDQFIGPTIPYRPTCPDLLPSSDETTVEGKAVPEIAKPTPETAMDAQAPQSAATPEVTAALPTATPTSRPTDPAAPEPTAISAPLTFVPTVPVTTLATITPTLPAQVLLTGKIVFPVFDPGKSIGGQPGGYDLWISDPEGNDRQLLVPDASQPQINPKGDLLAYRSWDPARRGISVVAIQGQGGELITDFLEDGLPSWAPDSKTMAFASRREGDKTPRLYRVNQLNGQDHWLGLFGEYVSTVPDGRLVFKGCNTDFSACGMFIAGPEGGQLNPISEDTSDTAPAPSPTGTQIAFMSFDREGAGNWEIYVVRSSGGKVTRLTNNNAPDGLPAWSPDGRTLAFASNRESEWAIWAMNPDGSNQRKLFNMGGSPDGRVGYAIDDSFGWTAERISWIP